MLLINGYLLIENIQYLPNNIFFAYEFNSPYLRARAVFALNSYINEQVVALLFCVSHLTRREVKNFINRI